MLLVHPAPQVDGEDVTCARLSVVNAAPAYRRCLKDLDGSTYLYLGYQDKAESGVSDYPFQPSSLNILSKVLPQ